MNQHGTCTTSGRPWTGQVRKPITFAAKIAADKIAGYYNLSSEDILRATAHNPHNPGSEVRTAVRAICGVLTEHMGIGAKHVATMLGRKGRTSDLFVQESRRRWIAAGSPDGDALLQLAGAAIEEADLSLDTTVKAYLRELASPAPSQPVTRSLVKKMCEITGAEDPELVRKKWKTA